MAAHAVFTALLVTVFSGLRSIRYNSGSRGVMRMLHFGTGGTTTGIHNREGHHATSRRAHQRKRKDS